MSALDVGLVVALALLAVLVAAQGRALAAAARRLELLERRLARRERVADDRSRTPEPVAATAHPHPADPAASGAASGAATGAAAPPATAEPEGDAVDVRGTDPEGQPTTVPLEATDQPTLLAFLSTSCSICTGLWDRLRAGELGSEVPGMVPVVVTRDAGQEDVERIRALATSEAPVVLSSEAWDDYEVPGSPYLMVVSAAPGSVVSEGRVETWPDLVRMARAAAG